MALSMDSPLGLNPQALLMKTVHDLQDCIQELKKEFSESGNIPITDDSQTLQRFCAKLEFLLQAGLKSRSSLLGGKKDYWNYFCDCLASNKGLNDGIRFVKTVSELKTNLGKGRAFIRFCLVQRRLADSLQQCIYNNRVTSDWYTAMAVWVQQRAVSPLINILYDLNDLQFDLSPQGYDLDASWPTFARKSFGGSGSFNWAPPSRSTSISSLASLPQQNDSFGFGSSLSSFSEPELERVKAELNETENEKLHLQVKLETMEDERRNLMKKTVVLEQQLSQLREEKTALEIQCAKSESEMSALEERHKGSEAVLQEKLKSAEVSMNELRQRVVVTNTMDSAAKTNAATANMQDVEQRMRLITLQKELAASKLELKNGNLQLQMKIKIDEGKTKLIETLEARLARSETSKKDLLEKVESFFAKHEREEQGHTDIVDQMKHLKMIMTEKEKANESLKKINSELREMLMELEDKSRKISALAKEKVLKYVDQNKQLQERVDTLQTIVAEKDVLINGAQGIDIDAKIKEAIEEKHKLIDDKEELRLEVDSLKTSLQEVREEMTEMRKTNDSTKSRKADSETEAGGSEGNPIAMMKNLQEKARQRQGSTDAPDSPRKTSANEELSKLLSEKTDLEVQLMELKAKNCELEDLISDLNMKIIEKDNSIKNLELELANTRTVLTTVENGLDGHVEIGQEKAVSSRLQKKIQKFLGDQQNLQMELQVAEGGNLELKKSNETLNQQVDEMTSENRTLSLQLAELKTLVSQSEVLNADLESRVEELDLDHKEKVKVIEELQVKVKESGDSQANLHKKSAELQAELEEKMKLLKEVESEKTIALSQVKDLRDNLDLLNSEGDKKQDEVKSVINESLELKEKLHRLTSNIKELEDSKGGLILSKSALEEALKEKELQLIQANEALSDIEVNVSKSIEEKILSVKSRLSEERECRKRLEDEISKMKQKNEENVIQVKSIEESRQKGEEEHSEQVKELNDKLKSLLAEQEKLQKQQTDADTAYAAEKDMLQKDRDTLQKDKDALQKDKDTLQKDNESLQKDNESLQKDKNALQKDNKSLQKDKDTLQKDKDTLQIDKYTLLQGKETLALEIEEIKKEGDQISSERNLLGEEMDRLKKNIEELTSDKLDLEAKINDFEVEVKELEERVKSVTNEVETVTVARNNLQQSYDELLQECERSKGAADQATFKLEGALENIKELEKKIADLDEKIHEMENDASNYRLEIDNLKVELNELRQNVNVLEAENNVLCENLTRSSNDSSEKYSSLSEDQTKLVEKLTKVTEENKTLVAQMENLKQEKSDARDYGDKFERKLKRREEELTSLKEELEAIKLRQNGREEDFAQRMDDLEGAKDVLEKEVSALQFQLSAEQMQQTNSSADLKELMEKLAYQEGLVDALEQELNDVKSDREKEEERRWKELEELRRNIQDKDEECLMLSSELKRTTKLLEEEKSLALKIKNDSLEMEEKLTKELDHTKTNMESLREDYSKVKGHLIKIVKDKATLWQQKDTLEDVRKLFVNAKWMDSGSVRSCMDCKAEFSLLLRKHHCRKCGRIFCHACSNNYIDVPYSSKKERVCNDCIQTMSHLETSALQEELESSSEQYQGPYNSGTSPRQDGTLGVTGSPVTGSSPMATASAGLFGSLLGAIGLSSGATDPAILTTPSSSVGMSKAIAPLTSSTPTKVLSGSLRTAPGSLERQNNPEEERQQEAEGHFSSAESEDNFDVITDQEVMQSMHESLIGSDPKSHSAGLVTVQQIEDGKVMYEPELWVAAGRVYAVPVLIEEPGVELAWEFSTQPKDIGFGVTYRETSVCSAEDHEILIETIKCNSHRRPVQGELLARKVGVYTLLFDNTHSRFTSKQLTYKLDAKSVMEDDPSPDEEGRIDEELSEQIPS